MKPSEQMIDSVIQAILDCAGPDAIASHMAEPIARAAIVAVRANERTEGWVLCHPDDPISEDVALVGQHTCSEWLNDNAPIGEAMYRSPALGTFKAMLRAKLAEEG